MVHPVLSSLDWSIFSPSITDLELMVRVVGSFLPACHAFLGTFFVQIDWSQLVQSHTSPARLFPALLCLLVKLSCEPNVRQTGKILTILQHSVTWTWSHVDHLKYESLAQWLVMSIDCKCIVKHHERNSLDEAVLKLFKAAAEFDSDSLSENGVKKQRIWVKCCTRLLSSCSSKHKNFLSYNQPALHTSVRRVLEDINIISTTDPGSSAIVVKDFLTLLNSNNNSVLPGSSLMVLQSWLRTNNTPLHSLLNQAGLSIHDVRTAATVLESVLESCFQDEECSPTWVSLLDHVSWPSGTRLQQMLEQAVQSGHLLLLHSYLCYRRPLATSLKEEQMFASTVLDWLRNISPGPGVETKLPLLYRHVITLLQRQNSINADQGWVVNMIIQLCDVLTNIADSSPGTDHSRY